MQVESSLTATADLIADPGAVSLSVATAAFQSCYWAHPDAVVTVWEPGARYERGLCPNRIGCTECGEMTRIQLNPNHDD